MTREEFIASYCENCATTWEEFREWGWDAYPCYCDYEHCQGWQMASQPPDPRIYGNAPPRSET